MKKKGHGIPDYLATACGRETMTAVKWLDSAKEVERAHRLGRHNPGQHRPVIVKFTSFKTNDPF